jgi:hypothetical protein
MYQKYKTFEEFRDGLFTKIVSLYKPTFDSIKIKIDDNIEIKLRRGDRVGNNDDIEKIWIEYVNYFIEKRKEEETNSSDDSS